MPIHQCTQHQHPSQPTAQKATVSALLATRALLTVELYFHPLQAYPGKRPAACTTLTQTEKQHPTSYGKAGYITNDM